MQARNLNAVVAGYRAVGARCVVVTGVIDAARGVPADLVPNAALTVCRLRADRDELARRYLERQYAADALPGVLHEADVMDGADYPGLCVDTTGLSAAGAQHLVMVGRVGNTAEAKIYAEALPKATITLCRLHAGREALMQRITLRGQGKGWPQPGGPLKERSEAYLRTVADEAAADSAALERAAFGDLRVDTNGRTAAESPTRSCGCCEKITA